MLGVTHDAESTPGFRDQPLLRKPVAIVFNVS